MLFLATPANAILSPNLVWPDGGLKHDHRTLRLLSQSWIRSLRNTNGHRQQERQKQSFQHRGPRHDHHLECCGRNFHQGEPRATEVASVCQSHETTAIGVRHSTARHDLLRHADSKRELHEGSSHSRRASPLAFLYASEDFMHAGQDVLGAHAEQPSAIQSLEGSIHGPGIGQARPSRCYPACVAVAPAETMVRRI